MNLLPSCFNSFLCYLFKRIKELKVLTRLGFCSLLGG